MSTVCLFCGKPLFAEPYWDDGYVANCTCCACYWYDKDRVLSAVSWWVNSSVSVLPVPRGCLAVMSWEAV